VSKTSETNGRLDCRLPRIGATAASDHQPVLIEIAD
jgi:endonuclease/exonuclease/phosphatase family metal-dependent hydrolase